MGVVRDDQLAPAARLPLERFLGGVPPVLGLALGVVFVAVVGLVDHLSGPSVSLSPFYFMPVVLVTWNAGRVTGAGLAVLAAITRQAANAWIAPTAPAVPLWNVAVWVSVLTFVVWLVSALKGAVMSQRTRLEEETELTDDLRSQNELKDTLLHAVSHDLKGPLAGVLGAMQTIRRSEQLNLTSTELNDLYGVIEQAGAKAARLVDDLLDLDRLGRGQLQPEREPTDVAELARRCAAELPVLAGHPVRVEGDGVLVDVDTSKVERIIDNLLGNAGRHTDAGTPIRVEVHARPNGVVLVVEDEGQGVPDEIKDPIFEPFRQGGEARGGVGIGLSLVRRFAELHGGTAHVEDRTGGGARFVVVLPGEVTDAKAGTLRAV